MVITLIEEFSKHKSKIYLDDEFAFVLYKGELCLYHMTVGSELSQEAYCEIMDKVLTKRARLRAMHLLTRKAYTERQLREKLRQGFYPEAVIEDAIRYVSSFHYTDDLNFAVSYISDHEDDRSRRRMERDLLQKGISREILEQAWREWESRGGVQDEVEMIRRLMTKRGYCAGQTDLRAQQKMYRFLCNKGFSADAIRKVMGSEEY